MLNLYGLTGRVFSGTLEQFRALPGVAVVSRARRIGGRAGSTEEPSGEASSTVAAGAEAGVGRQVLAAYGAPSKVPVRRPLLSVAEVMTRPAIVVPVDTSVRDAWRFLGDHHIRQAPVIGAHGILVGLVARTALLPTEVISSLESNPQAWRARLDQPVSVMMWSPVPSVVPATRLRDLAGLLLETGLPGVPVTDDVGQLVGFVSRSDLLRALASDPALDLWG